MLKDCTLNHEYVHFHNSPTKNICVQNLAEILSEREAISHVMQEGKGSRPLSCVKIQKITNLLTLGQIKLYKWPVSKNPKKKIPNFDFECAKLDFCKQ